MFSVENKRHILYILFTLPCIKIYIITEPSIICQLHLTLGQDSLSSTILKATLEPENWDIFNAKAATKSPPSIKDSKSVAFLLTKLYFILKVRHFFTPPPTIEQENRTESTIMF